MADYCANCSRELFGEDHGDLRGLVTEDEWDHGYCAVALCEGCGPTWVDPQGNCVRPWCFSQTTGHSTQTNRSLISEVPGVGATFRTGDAVEISSNHHEFPREIARVESCEVERTPDGPSVRYFVRFEKMITCTPENGETFQQDWAEVDEQELQLAEK